MTFSIHGKLALIILAAFHINWVYGTTDHSTEDYQSKSESLDVSRSDDNEGGVVKTVLSDSYDLSDENKCFSYSVEESSQTTLKYPARITKIKFNNVIVEFGDSATLPSDVVSSVALYTCKHGNPVLINVKSQNKNYFYATGQYTDKWSNHTITSLDEYGKEDENGVKYYGYDITGQDNSVGEKYFGQVNKERSNISQKLCKEDCVDNTADSPTFEILLYPVDVSTEQQQQRLRGQETEDEVLVQSEESEVTEYNPGQPSEPTEEGARDSDELQSTQAPQQEVMGQSIKDSQPERVETLQTGQIEHIELGQSHYYSHKENKKQKMSESGEDQQGKDFSIYAYIFNENTQKKFARLNSVMQVVFNDAELAFEDLTKLPYSNAWLSFTIFLCEHNRPAIVRIKVKENGTDYHYHYVLNSESRKFKNTTITFLSEQSETDSNGLIRYTIPDGLTSATYCDNISKSWDESFGDLCKDHQEATEKIDTPLLKLSVNLNEVVEQDVDAQQPEEVPVEQSDSTEDPQEDAEQNDEADATSAGDSSVPETADTKILVQKSKTVKFSTSNSYEHKEEGHEKAVSGNTEGNSGDNTGGNAGGNAEPNNNQDNTPNLFTYLSYYIDAQKISKIKGPKHLEHIKIKDYILEFEDMSKLPDYTTWGYFVVLNCKHNRPFLVRFKVNENGKGYHYYYLLDSESNKFKNANIRSLDQQPENDTNGLIRYIIPESSTYSGFCEKIQEIWPEMSDRVCQEHKTAATYFDKPSLEISFIVFEEQKPPKQKGKNIVKKVVEYCKKAKEYVTSINWGRGEQKQSGQGVDTQEQNVEESKEVAQVEQEQPEKCADQPKQDNGAETQEQSEAEIVTEENTNSESVEDGQKVSQEQAEVMGEVTKEQNTVEDQPDDNDKVEDVNEVQSDGVVQEPVNSTEKSQQHSSGHEQAQEDSSNQDGGILKIDEDFSHCHKENDNTLFTYHSYYIEQDKQQKLAHPNIIERILFNSVVVEFEDPAKFPNLNTCSFITVFACKHNKPLITRFKVTEDKKDYHYFYLLNLDSGKFKNIGLTSLDEKSETDSNGLTRHHKPKNVKASQYAKKIEKDWTGFTDKLCQDHEEATETLQKPPIEVTLTSSVLSNGLESRGDYVAEEQNINPDENIQYQSEENVDEKAEQRPQESVDDLAQSEQEEVKDRAEEPVSADQSEVVQEEDQTEYLEPEEDNVELKEQSENVEQARGVDIESRDNTEQPSEPTEKAQEDSAQVETTEQGVDTQEQVEEVDNVQPEDPQAEDQQNETESQPEPSPAQQDSPDQPSDQATELQEEPEAQPEEAPQDETREKREEQSDVNAATESGPEQKSDSTCDNQPAQVPQEDHEDPQPKEPAQEDSTESTQEEVPVEQSDSTAQPANPVTVVNDINQQTDIVQISADHSYEHKEGSAEDKADEKNTQDNKPTLFTYLSYHISGKCQKELKDSNKVVGFIFNNNELIFEDLSKFPDPKFWTYVAILVCAHNSPILVRIRTNESNKSYHYYFVVDPTTNTFKNTRMSSLEEQPEDDTNGLTRYTVPTGITTKGFCEKIENEWIKLTENMCKEHHSATNSIGEPHLELTIVLSEKQIKKRDKKREKEEKREKKRKDKEDKKKKNS